MNVSDRELSRRAEQRLRSKLAFTIAELVSGSGIGRSKIYEEIAAGRLKVRKLGKRMLVLHDDALAWLENLPVG